MTIERITIDVEFPPAANRPSTFKGLVLRSGTGPDSVTLGFATLVSAEVLPVPQLADRVSVAELRAACGGGDVVIRTDGTLATLEVSTLWCESTRDGKSWCNHESTDYCNAPHDSEVPYTFRVTTVGGER